MSEGNNPQNVRTFSQKVRDKANEFAQRREDDDACSPHDSKISITVEDSGLDMLKIPPDFDLAKKHGKSQEIKKFEQWEEGADYCPCCNFPTGGEAIGLCGHTKHFSDLGAGFPLYYQFLKYWIWMLFIGFAISGAYALSENFSSERDEIKDEEEIHNSYIVRSSLGNYVADNDWEDAKDSIQPTLNVIVICILILSYNVIRRMQIRVNRRIDQKVLTAADYTIWVRNLPADTNKEEIEEFFKKYGKVHGLVEIVKTNLAYDFGDFAELIKEKEAIASKKQQVQMYMDENDGKRPEFKTWYGRKRPYPHPSEYEKTLKELEKKIDWCKEQMVDENPKLVGHAFVTMRLQTDAEQTHQLWSVSIFTKLWYIILSKCCGSQQTFQFKGRILSAERAPEPSDVMWENLGVTGAKRFRNTLTTSIATLILLGLAFGVLMLLSLWQEDLKDSVSNQNSRDYNDRFKIGAISMVSALALMVTNALLGKSIRLFVRFERRQTETSYSLSVALKLGLALFVNTTILVYILNSRSEDWYSPGGLIEDVFYIMFANAIIPPLAQIFDYSWYKRRKERKKEIEKGMSCELTQKEANELWEGLPIDLAQSYANVIKTITLALVYAPVLPLAWLLCAFGLWFGYWAEKYHMLKRCVRPNNLGDHMNTVITNLTPYWILLFALSNLAFFSQGSEGYSSEGLVGVCIAAGYILLPVQRIFDTFCSGKDFDRDLTPFDEAQLEFLEDYDRVNPVTQDEANAEWVKTIVAKKGDDTEIRQYANDLAQVQNDQEKPVNRGMGMINNINNYAVTRTMYAGIGGRRFYGGNANIFQANNHRFDIHLRDDKNRQLAYGGLQNANSAWGRPNQKAFSMSSMVRTGRQQGAAVMHRMMNPFRAAAGYVNRGLGQSQNVHPQSNFNPATTNTSHNPTHSTLATNPQNGGVNTSTTPNTTYPTISGRMDMRRDDGYERPGNYDTGVGHQGQGQGTYPNVGQQGGHGGGQANPNVGQGGGQGGYSTGSTNLNGGAQGGYHNTGYQAGGVQGNYPNVGGGQGNVQGGYNQVNNPGWGQQGRGQGQSNPGNPAGNGGNYPGWGQAGGQNYGNTGNQGRYPGGQGGYGSPRLNQGGNQGGYNQGNYGGNPTGNQGQGNAGYNQGNYGSNPGNNQGRGNYPGF
eukprot:CAMPEP_0115022088 /NCGR_PEP_ID=MMETSP0216-20121206/31305_1 /TAXON_ID=223996 /ORGANISM="Protocruzia adherens, Strain Boccale" /LENGTH=1152 /DNA_ID=CAMNT_0002394631 /DNA_START=120 /DNA_END=3578 /DNA_ORIENTATION=-